MKKIMGLAFLLTVSSAFAGDVLLTCGKTPFDDLDGIVVTTGDELSEVEVTEIPPYGPSNTEIRRAKDFFGKKEVKLSNWDGLPRVLFNNGNEWLVKVTTDQKEVLFSVDCQ